MAGELVGRPPSLASARSQFNLARPSDEERAAHLRATQNAMDELIASMTGETRAAPRAVSTTYKPKGSNVEHSLKIVEQQNDPLEPPRHRYRKPRPFDDGVLALATPDTKAPILRRPPERLTKEQKQEWMIPRSVSNWKNGRGYMIDLDERSASGPKQSPTVNSSKRADLAAALSAASDEVATERAGSGLDKQHRLREKLRAQKQAGPKSPPELGTPEDLFDTRLFQSASKKRHDLYDTALFTDRKRTKHSKSVQFERE